MMKTGDKIVAKNVKVELFRIFFTLLIIVHHFQNSYDMNFVHYGWIAVDFFFILSGYLLGVSLENPVALFTYAKKRITRLYPQYFISTCLTFALYRITMGVLNPQKAIPELLMIQNSGLCTGGGYNGSLWYISVLLILSICLYSLCRNDQQGIVKGLLLFVALAGYTYLIGSENGLESWTFDGLIYPPLVRGLSGLSLGVSLHEIQKEYNGQMSQLSSVVYCMISCALVLCLLAGIESYSIAIFGFCGIILDCFYPHKNKIADRKADKFIVTIGRWCYGAYLFHIAAIKIVAVLLRIIGKLELMWLNLACSVGASFLMAAVTEIVINCIGNISREK